MTGQPADVRIGYLGPPGTFTEQATKLLQLPGRQVTVPLSDVPAVLDAVLDDRVDAGLVPIENSVEGGVNPTLDALSRGPQLRIVAEALLPVSFVLAARAGTTLADVTVVLSHGHGLAQCRRWVAEHLPTARTQVSASTAQAAAAVAAGEVPGGAAVCAAVAAEHHGLTVLAEGVGDNAQAVTRFVLVARPDRPLGALPAPTGADRTSVVLFIRENHPGALLEVLQQFAARGVDLSRLESRPTGEAIGAYCFAVDCEGHVGDARVGEALAGLHRLCRDVRFLGSYPRADGAITDVRPGDDRGRLHQLRGLARAGARTTVTPAAAAGLPGWRSMFAGTRGRLVVGLLTLEFVGAVQALITVAILPAVSASLGMPRLAPWTFTATNCASIAAFAVAGRWVDRAGPLVALGLGIPLTGLGLLVAALAPTMPVLVGARAVQGFGLGLQGTVLLSSVATMFPPVLRPRLLALTATMWVLPGVVAPGLGLAVTAALGWRWVFGGFLPLLVISAVLAVPPLRTLLRGRAVATDAAPAPTPPAMTAGAVGSRLALAVGAAALLPF